MRQITVCAFPSIFTPYRYYGDVANLCSLPSTLALPDVHRVEVVDRILHIIGPEKGRLIFWTAYLSDGFNASNALSGAHPR